MIITVHPARCAHTLVVAGPPPRDLPSLPLTLHSHAPPTPPAPTGEEFPPGLESRLLVAQRIALELHEQLTALQVGVQVLAVARGCLKMCPGAARAAGGTAGAKCSMAQHEQLGSPAGLNSRQLAWAQAAGTKHQITSQHSVQQWYVRQRPINLRPPLGCRSGRACCRSGRRASSSSPTAASTRWASQACHLLLIPGCLGLQPSCRGRARRLARPPCDAKPALPSWRSPSTHPGDHPPPTSLHPCTPLPCSASHRWPP